MDIKDRIAHQFPEFIANEYPLFIKFVEHYYNFLDSSELVLSGITGTFVNSEGLLVATTEKASEVRGVDADNSRLFIKSQNRFVEGDVVSGLTSGATGTIVSMTPNPIRSIEELLDYRDIDATVSKYFTNFREEFMATIPNKLASGIDKRLVTKNIVDLYRTKGTSEGHKLFFKMLLDEDAEIYFPSEDILASSDGDWSFDTMLRVDKGSVISDVDVLVGSDILQKNIPLSSVINKAVAKIDSVKTFFNGVKEVIEMSINRDTIRGEFIAGQTIYVTGTDSIEYEFELAPILAKIVVTDGGENYGAFEGIKITGFDYPGIGIIDTVSSGYVSGIDIISGGTGYTNLGDLDFDETNTLGQGTDARISGVEGSINLENEVGEIVQEAFTVWASGIPEDKILFDSGSGDVVDTHITRFGFNYNRLPVITSDTSGTSAEFRARSVNVGAINEVRVVDPGFNVTSTITAVPDTVLVMIGTVGDFIIQETITSSSAGTGKVADWEPDISVLKLDSVSGTFSVADTITASTTGITGTIHRNTTATLTTETAVLFETPGRFVSEDGWVSSFAKRIQDNYYYQKFSYLVKCAESIINWRAAIKKAVHPAGFNVFGEIKIVSLLDAKMRIPTLASTLFTPELFSTFTDIFHTTFRRRLGAEASGTQNPNPQIGVSGIEPDQPQGNRASGEGNYDVRLRHEYLVEWIKPWENYAWKDGPQDGSTLYNLNRYKFIDPPTTFSGDYYYITGTVAGTWDYGVITTPHGGLGYDYGDLSAQVPEPTETHDYPGVHRMNATNVGYGSAGLPIGTHVVSDSHWVHPDTGNTGVPGGYSIDQWASFTISDIDGGKVTRHNIPPPSEITLKFNNWLTFTTAPEATTELLYYRLPSVGTYNNRNYTSSGSSTFTVTAGQSYIVHLDGVIQPSSVYSINTTVLTFSTPPVSGSVVEIREMSSSINERIYTGSGATYTVTPNKALLVYINNIIQENIVDYNILGSTITISSVLTGSDTLMILELQDDLIDRDGIGDGSTRNFAIVANADNNNSLVYVSGVYQMPTTNYTVT